MSKPRTRARVRVSRTACWARGHPPQTFKHRYTDDDSEDLNEKELAEAAELHGAPWPGLVTGAVLGVWVRRKRPLRLR